MKKRLIDIAEVFGTLIWHGFGLFLFILGGAGFAGAIVSGDWFQGILTAWITLMMGVIAALGYAIAITGRATKSDVKRAIRDAVEKAKPSKED